MYEVYRLKNPEQPFPRTLVGSFRTPNEIMDKLKLDAETTFRMVCGETVDGMQVEKSAEFLRISEPRTEEEIGRILGAPRDTIHTQLRRALKKLYDAGTLRELLEMIHELRSIEEKPGRFEVEMTTTVKISSHDARDTDGDRD